MSKNNINARTNNKARVSKNKSNAALKWWYILPVIAIVAVAGYLIVRLSQASYIVPKDFIDISSPQCGSFTDRLSKNAYGIVGLNGTYMNFGTNPCLRQQIGKFTNYELYVGANYPSGECTRRGISDPYGCGVAAAEHNLDLIKFLKLYPKRLWIDVETGPNITWSSQSNNRQFIKGLYDRMNRNGYIIGYYSTPTMWKNITGGANLGGDGNWLATGRTDRDSAVSYCKQSFGGKSTKYVQWVSGGKLDFNYKCY